MATLLSNDHQSDDSFTSVTSTPPLPTLPSSLNTQAHSWLGRNLSASFTLTFATAVVRDGPSGGKDGGGDTGLGTPSRSTLHAQLIENGVAQSVTKYTPKVPSLLPSSSTGISDSKVDLFHSFTNLISPSASLGLSQQLPLYVIASTARDSDQTTASLSSRFEINTPDLSSHSRQPTPSSISKSTFQWSRISYNEASALSYDDSISKQQEQSVKDSLAEPREHALNTEIKYVFQKTLYHSTDHSSIVGLIHWTRLSDRDTATNSDFQTSVYSGESTVYNAFTNVDDDFKGTVPLSSHIASDITTHSSIFLGDISLATSMAERSTTTKPGADVIVKGDNSLTSPLSKTFTKSLDLNSSHSFSRDSTDSVKTVPFDSNKDSIVGSLTIQPTSKGSADDTMTKLTSRLKRDDISVSESSGSVTPDLTAGSDVFESSRRVANSSSVIIVPTTTQEPISTSISSSSLSSKFYMSSSDVSTENVTLEGPNFASDATPFPLIIVLPVCLAFLLLATAVIIAMAFFCYRRRKRKRANENSTEDLWVKTGDDQVPPVSVSSVVESSIISNGLEKRQEDVLYQVTHEFEAQLETQLGLKMGDVVTVEQCADNGWWLGRIPGQDRTGWFPSGYVEEIKKGSDVEEVKAQQNESNPETPKPRISSFLIRKKQNNRSLRENSFNLSKLPTQPVKAKSSTLNSRSNSTLRPVSPVHLPVSISSSVPVTSSTVSPEEFSTLVKGKHFKAHFAYKAAYKGELTLKEGDIIIGKERDKNGWMLGKKLKGGREEGWFPAVYVDQITGEFQEEEPQPQMHGMVLDSEVYGQLAVNRNKSPDQAWLGIEHKARFLYKARSPNELSFGAGDTVIVLEALPSGWWLGCHGDDIGWFPGEYLELIELEPETTGDSPLDTLAFIQLKDSLKININNGMSAATTPVTSHHSSLADTKDPTDKKLKLGLSVTSCALDSRDGYELGDAKSSDSDASSFKDSLHIPDKTDSKSRASISSDTVLDGPKFTPVHGTPQLPAADKSSRTSLNTVSSGTGTMSRNLRPVRPAPAPPAHKLRASSKVSLDYLNVSNFRTDLEETVNVTPVKRQKKPVIVRLPKEKVGLDKISSCPSPSDKPQSVSDLESNSDHSSEESEKEGITDNAKTNKIIGSLKTIDPRVEAGSKVINRSTESTFTSDNILFNLEDNKSGDEISSSDLGKEIFDLLDSVKIKSRELPDSTLAPDSNTLPDNIISSAASSQNNINNEMNLSSVRVNRNPAKENLTPPSLELTNGSSHRDRCHLPPPPPPPSHEHSNIVYESHTAVEASGVMQGTEKSNADASSALCTQDISSGKSLSRQTSDGEAGNSLKRSKVPQVLPYPGKKNPEEEDMELTLANSVGHVSKIVHEINRRVSLEEQHLPVRRTSLQHHTAPQVSDLDLPAEHQNVPSLQHEKYLPPSSSDDVDMHNSVNLLDKNTNKDLHNDVTEDGKDEHSVGQPPSNKKPPSKSKSTNCPRKLTAVVGYKAANEEELTFEAGATITQLNEKDQSGRAMGILTNGVKGLFPTSCTKLYALHTTDLESSC